MTGPRLPEDEERARLDRLRARFARIAERLRRSELQRLEDPDTLLTPEDLRPEHWDEDCWFLGFYSARGIRTALEAYGILRKLEAQGWHNFQIELDLRDRSDHRLRLYADGHGQHRALLAELVAHLGRVRFSPLTPRAPDEPPELPVDAVVLEWMTLQAPGLPFPPDRPRLPGQRWPGLGIGPEVIELLYRMGLRLRREAVIAFPAYYHNAVLYRVRFNFVSPEDEGRLRAYRRDLADLSLAEASWAFELGCVRDRETGAVVHWQGPELCMPLVGRVADRFADPRYEAIARRTAEAVHVQLDRERFRARLAAQLETDAGSDPSAGA